MNDFIFHNPDKVYFGKSHLKNLPAELLNFGKKVLLVYGGGSIKRNGLYDEIVSLCKESGIGLFELSGVEPNPRHSTANKAQRSASVKESMLSLRQAAVRLSTVQRALQQRQ